MEKMNNFKIENNILIKYYGEQKSIEIPNSVNYIGACAFDNCTSLESIEIPNGVTSIGACAFYHCTSLKTIEIPDSVTSIGDSAFYNCKSLENIVIPNSVNTIGEGAFENCESLKNTANFKIVHKCGEEDRTIFTFKNTVYIGCFKGSFKEAKEAIEKKYTQYNSNSLEDYLIKLNSLK